MTDPGRPLLEVVGVGVNYGGVAALCDAHLEVRDGEIVGLIGPNGAGKTTLLDVISGLHPPTTGTVRFHGQDVTRLPLHKRAGIGMARTFQSVEMFAPLTVEDNVLIAAEQRRWWHGLRDLIMPRAGRRADVDWVLEQFDISDLRNAFPDEIPNGRQRLVGLARALVQRPTLVLLDEPAAGLDTEETARLAAQLRRLRTPGSAMLLVEHDMELVLGVCDRIYVLDAGRMIAAGAPYEIRADPAVIAAYLGIAASESAQATG